MILSFDRKKEQKQLDAEQLHKAYKQLFSGEAGKVILEDLASISGMYRTNFVQGNSRHTSFLEGQRSLFLYICSHIEEKQINNIEGDI